MKVTHRLYLTGAPAVIGVLAVASLGYWGQYSRTVPETLLIVALIAALGTMVLSWVNVRYIAQRVERLANVSVASPVFDRELLPDKTHSASSQQGDELDEFENAVGRLSHAVTLAASDRAASELRAAERLHDYARMLVGVSETATRKLDEIRLPLHILLENHFGDLNENQEEMLSSARQAAEAADSEFTALREIAALDLDRKALRRDRIFLGDLMHAILPTLQASAEKNAVVLRADVDPLVPVIRGDQAQLQNAVDTLLRALIVDASRGAELHLEVVNETSLVKIVLRGVLKLPTTILAVLAMRRLEANGATVALTSNALILLFRAEEPAKPSRSMATRAN